jgi:hypothetical protein
MVLEWADGTHCGAIDPATLPISGDLRQELDNWYRYFSELYLRSGSPVEMRKSEWRLFDDTGYRIWLRLRDELNGSYDVCFASHRFSCLVENPKEWDALVKAEDVSAA